MLERLNNSTAGKALGDVPVLTGGGGSGLAGVLREFAIHVIAVLRSRSVALVL